MAVERDHLLRLAAEGFELAEGDYVAKAEPVLLIGDADSYRFRRTTVQRKAAKP